MWNEDTRMTDSPSASHADIGILWTVGDATRCLLARVDRQFEVRVVRSDAVIRRDRFDDLAPALARGAEWRREFSECV